MKTKLYCQDSKGKIRVWSVRTYKNGLTTRSGLLTGSLIEVDHPIRHGLGGRTKKEQKLLKARSMINKKLDKGYCYSVEDAKEFKKTNSMGYTIPMKAHRYDKMSEKDLDWMFEYCVYVQRKYNGHRCMIINDNGNLIAYSRGGKEITTIDKILDNDIDIPVGVTIDGELYRHGWKLQKISSHVKKYSKETDELVFMCYDTVSDAPYGERYRQLGSYGLVRRAQLAPTVLTKGRFNPLPILQSYVDEGYEGVIMRVDFGGYLGDERPKWLLKLKPLLDKEFMVSKITASKDGLAILTCVAENGKTFTVFAEGDHDKKRYELENKEDFIGRFIRIEFFERTEAGLPVPPIAKEWRNKRHE